MSHPPILCYAPVSCARVPLIALEEIGAPFETRLIAFMAGEHRSPDYLSINLTGKVPALITANGVIVQNPAILWHLARSHPEARLLPSPGDALSEAQLLSRIMSFSADLHPIVTRIAMPQFFTDLPEAIPNVRTKACEMMAMQIAPYETRLGQSEWLLGGDWSVLDAYLFWVWFRITGMGFDGAPYPHISRHHEAMKQRPAVQRALARETDALAELEARGLAVPKPKGV